MTSATSISLHNVLVKKNVSLEVSRESPIQQGEIPHPRAWYELYFAYL
jgi:hypothetical protein